MRHHQYNKKRKTHVYACPAKRPRRKHGKYGYSFHEDACPLKQNCEPDSSLGPFAYIRSAENPRLFPPVPRDSQRYQDIMNLRSGSERVNAVIDAYNIEGASRNADRSLVRIFFANIVQHAVIRYTESSKSDTDSGNPLLKRCSRRSAVFSPAPHGKRVPITRP